MKNSITTHSNISLVAIFVLLSLAACKVSWVPKYDADLEVQVYNTAKATNMFYIEMLEMPLEMRTYKSVSPKYMMLQSEIYAIELRLSGQKNNTELLGIIETIEAQFDKYINEHKALGDKPLNNTQIEIYNDWMKANWKPLYKAIQ